MNFPLMKNNIQAQDLEPVIELCRQNDPKLTSGPSVKEFEEKWSEWLGVKYSVFVNSGSSANLMAMAWLKTQYPNGGRVILPPFTWSQIYPPLCDGFRARIRRYFSSTLAIDEDKLEQLYFFMMM